MAILVPLEVGFAPLASSRPRGCLEGVGRNAGGAGLLEERVFVIVVGSGASRRNVVNSKEFPSTSSTYVFSKVRSTVKCCGRCSKSSWHGSETIRWHK